MCKGLHLDTLNVQRYIRPVLKTAFVSCKSPLRALGKGFRQLTYA